jgi:TRAP-type mannitol/chloroaromatic compound transport system substrate-binding protein
MKKIKRRDFLKKASIVTFAGTSSFLLACSDEEGKGGPAIHSNKKYEWKMVTAWPPHFPILGEGADNLAKQIEEMSGGRLKIHVYGGGELVPPLESFDAVSQGVAEMSHAASYYWAGKSPAAQFFSTIPFGMNTLQANSWLYYGGGLDLWKEVYNDFNLIPFPSGNSGGQMGGWFNKEINSIADVKGLKMRLPGLGGKVITKAGGSAVLSAGGEIYTNLERGVIDATDWIGPYHDYLLGLHQIAKYYYYPGWQEPTAVIELAVNKDAYNNLPKDLQLIIQTAAQAANVKMVSDFETKNVEYYKKLREETDVQFRKFPESVLKTFKKNALEVINEVTSSDPMSKKVYESYKKFQIGISEWTGLAEKNYGISDL